MILGILGNPKQKHIRLCAAFMQTMSDCDKSNAIYHTSELIGHTSNELMSIAEEKFLRENTPSLVMFQTGDNAVVAENALVAFNNWDNTKEVSKHVKIESYDSKSDLLYQSIKCDRHHTFLQHIIGDITYMYYNKEQLDLYTSEDNGGLYYLPVPTEGVYISNSKDMLKMLAAYANSSTSITELDANQIYRFKIVNDRIKIYKLERLTSISKQINSVPSIKKRKNYKEVLPEKVPQDCFEIIQGLYYLNGELASGVYYTKVDGSFVSVSPFANAVQIFIYKGIPLKNVEAVREIMDKDVVTPYDLQGYSLIPIPKDAFTEGTYKNIYILPELDEWVNPIIGEPLSYVHGDFYYPFTTTRYTFEANHCVERVERPIEECQHYWAPLFPNSKIKVIAALETINQELIALREEIKRNPILEREYQITLALNDYLAPHIESLK